MKKLNILKFKTRFSIFSIRKGYVNLEPRWNRGHMSVNLDVAKSVVLEEVVKIAKKLKLSEMDIEQYGRYKAKIQPNVWDKIKDNTNGKLILVTSMNPTKFGEGKTTTTIGLSDALNSLGYKTSAVLREPALGPCFGIKGGATGGGHAQVAPVEDIDLHFTGDFHAITSAHNLLAAIIDNHIYQGNSLNIDPKRISWKRVLDVNDRALRNIVIGLGKKTDGITRESGFDITVASELMAILCLSENLQDMKSRIARIIVAYDYEGREVTCDMLNATGALSALLRTAIQPNIVQTLEGNPAIIHGGPFANIAHGCNSLIATKYALKLADYVVTEAGFGADLGAEKFLDIKCPLLGAVPDTIVIVATIKALKLHGKNESIQDGYKNLAKHIENIKRYNLPVVISINHFTSDTEDELNTVKEMCRACGVDVALSTVWADGARGGQGLAQKVLHSIETNKTKFCPLYQASDSPFVKIEKIAKEIYGADGVDYLSPAQAVLQQVDQNESWRNYPVCIAKTQYSLSDNPNLVGRPQDFRITVRDAKIMNGAGFVVIYTGDILTMPGLPSHPAAEDINIDEHGEIIGLF